MAGYIGSKAVNLSTTGADINGDANIDGDLSFRDNDKIKLGAGSDLQIYHDGANSYIQDVGTGALGLFGSTFVGLYETVTGDKMVIANGGSDVELYYDNALKLATTSTGISVTGNATFADNGKAIFGAGSDLQIYHDGGNSLIEEAGVGNLIIRGSGNVDIQPSGGGAYMARFAASGAASLYNNGSPKLATTSTGIDVTGTVTADGLTVDGNGAFSSTNPYLAFIETDLTNESTRLRQTSGSLYIQKTDNSGGFLQNLARFNTNGDISFYNGSGNAKFFWDASAEQLVIGGSTSAGDAAADDLLVGQGSGNQGLTVYSGTSSTGNLFFKDSSSNFAGYVQYSHSDNSMRVGTATTEAMRIDSSGNLLVGKTSSSLATDGIEAKANGSLFVTRSSATPVSFRRSTTDGDIVAFYKDGSTVGSIGTKGGDIHVGTGVTGLQFVDSINKIRPFSVSGNAATDGTTDLGQDSQRFKDLYLSGTAIVGDGSGSSFGTVRILGGATSGYSNLQFADGNDTNVGMIQYSHGSNYMQFTTNDDEAMRLDSSGNLLVNTTNTAPADNNVEGTAVIGGGQLQASKDGATVAKFNRKGTDGDILRFNKNGSTVGSIGNNGVVAYVNFYNAGNVALKGSTNAVVPATTTGADRDNAIDLGKNDARFDDIYATNGTIQTSDRNEKQDIAELSDAEQRVAVAAKGLLRKFRWRDAVEAKGDEARTHFGVIAQDLQAAFAAEGLDAGDYAMFISSTWTDEETGEERTRMGVRYSELLAFIIGAL